MYLFPDTEKTQLKICNTCKVFSKKNHKFLQSFQQQKISWHLYIRVTLHNPFYCRQSNSFEKTFQTKTYFIFWRLMNNSDSEIFQLLVSYNYFIQSFLTKTAALTKLLTRAIFHKKIIIHIANEKLIAYNKELYILISLP